MISSHYLIDANVFVSFPNTRELSRDTKSLVYHCHIGILTLTRHLQFINSLSLTIINFFMTY